MAEIILTSAAERDYAESLAWYLHRSVSAADAFDAAVARGLEMIASDPERFPQCDSRHRYYLIDRFPFQIIYRIHNEDVLVIAVAHLSRDPGYWLGR